MTCINVQYMYNYTVPQILASVLPGVACDSTINDSLIDSTTNRYNSCLHNNKK